MIKEEVLPKIGYPEYIKDNIKDISEYIFSEFEGSLSDLASSKGLTRPEEEILNLYSKAVTEITTRKDFR